MVRTLQGHGQNVFTKEEVGKVFFFNANFINLKLDMETLMAGTLKEFIP